MNPFDPLSDDDLLSDDEAGCPKAPDGRAVAPWIRKDKRWRVTPLARGKTPLFPPDVGKPTEAFLEENDLLGTGFRVPTVVLGPAGAGLFIFYRWIRLRARQANVRLVELDFARIAQAADPARQRAVFAASLLDSDAATTGLSDDLAGLLDQLLLLEDPEAPSNGQLRSYILLRVDRFHRENMETLLAKLRDFVERRVLRVRFTVLTHETAPLEAAGPFSSFLNVCDVYRLADFTAADIEALWRTWVPDRAMHAPEVARHCIDWTGGLPVLVNLYLGRLFDTTDIEKEISRSSFDHVGAWLVQHPPQADLKHWQGELARMVDESSLLRRKVGSFLAGEVRGSVTREELPLFLAGWIGQDAEGRWAIRSRAHARWAEGPLRAPGRYRVEGDGQ